ncbi:ECF transporter S component, partial [Candidatus Darwinibacter acetoxidans]
MKAEVRESASRKRIYFATRDLLIMAVLSGIGGVLSTYVGYLGNLLNRLFGVPFGAGQFVAGLHVFWIILAAGLVRRPGAATIVGLLKGVVELLT